jgi:hypothetical protein
VPAKAGGKIVQEYLNGRRRTTRGTDRR